MVDHDMKYQHLLSARFLMNEAKINQDFTYCFGSWPVHSVPCVGVIHPLGLTLGMGGVLDNGSLPV